MHIDQETRQGVTIVTVLQDRVDLEIAPVLKGRLRDAIEAGARHLILDLEAVDFIDSSGLSVVVSALRALGDAGRLAIAGAHGNVRDTLRLTRMDRIVAVFATQSEAISELAGP